MSVAFSNIKCAISSDYMKVNMIIYRDIQIGEKMGDDVRKKWKKIKRSGDKTRRGEERCTVIQINVYPSIISCIC